MMIKTNTITCLLLLIASIMLVSTAQASTCDIEFKYDIHISNQRISIKDGYNTLYEIDKHNQLLIRNTPVEVDERTQQNITDFANGMRQELPRLIDTINEGVVLALDTLQKVGVSIFGQSDFSQDLLLMLEKLKYQFSKHLYHNGNTTFVSHDVHDWIERDFDKQIEKIVEEANASIGTRMIKDLGHAIFSSEGDFKSRLHLFAKQMEEKLDTLDKQFSAQSKTLERHAYRHCVQMERLSQLESKIRRSVPEISGAKLIRI